MTRFFHSITIDHYVGFCVGFAVCMYIGMLA